MASQRRFWRGRLLRCLWRLDVYARSTRFAAVSPMASSPDEWTHGEVDEPGKAPGSQSCPFADARIQADVTLLCLKGASAAMRFLSAL